MMLLSKEYTSTSMNPILRFIQELYVVCDDRDKGIKVIQKRRELFWPLTKAASDGMTQLGSLDLGRPITHVLFLATLEWSIKTVSDSVSQSLTGFSDALGLTAWVDCWDCQFGSQRREDSTFVDLISFLAFIASGTLWSEDATLSESIRGILSNEFVDFLPAALRFCHDGRSGRTLVEEAKKALSVVIGGMVHIGLRWEYFSLAILLRMSSGCRRY